jgi:ferritin-like metal-binding protein YciE
MAANPDVLADGIRAKRAAIDNDLELLRLRLVKADPRRRIDAKRMAARAVPIVAGAAALWLWRSRRQRVHSLERLLVHELTDLYHAEHQLLPALDLMCKRAWNEEVERALARHRAETEGHIERLDRVFRSVGARPQRGSSPTVAALIEEGEQLLGSRMRRDVKDAWLIATAQRIEHLEIAGYGTARSHAHLLGYLYASQLLQQTLEEEKTMDETLTRLADRFVNPQTIRHTTAT